MTYGYYGKCQSPGCQEVAKRQFNFVGLCDWHHKERIATIPVPERYRNYP